MSLRYICVLFVASTLEKEPLNSQDPATPTQRWSASSL